MNLKNSEIIDIGDLRFRCTLQVKIAIPDGMGGNSYSYSDFKTVWCDVRNQTGNYDKNRADHIETQYQKQFTVRYNSIFRNNMLIEYDGYRYRITTIEKIGGIESYMLIKAESSEDMKV